MYFRKTIISGVVISLLPLLGAQFDLATRAFVSSPAVRCGAPVSAWPMNEGSGLTFHDSSSNSNNATLSGSGAVTWQTNGTLPGTTPLFTGSGSASASIATPTNFDGTTGFSVQLWVVGASGGSAEAYIGNNKTGPSNQGWFFINDAEQLQFALINNNAGSVSLINFEGSTVFPATGTHYAGVTYDPSQAVGNQVKLYIDGVNKPGNYVTDNLSGSTASGLVALMGNSNVAAWPLTHAMAFVEVFPCVNTPTQIAAMYALGPGIY